MPVRYTSDVDLQYLPLAHRRQYVYTQKFSEFAFLLLADEAKPWFHNGSWGRFSTVAMQPFFVLTSGSSR